MIKEHPVLAIPLLSAAAIKLLKPCLVDPIIALLVVDLNKAIVKIQRKVKIQQRLIFSISLINVITDDALVIPLIALLGPHVGLLHLVLTETRLLRTQLHEWNENEQALSCKLLDVDQVGAEVLSLDAAGVQRGEEVEQDAVIVFVYGDLDV